MRASAGRRLRPAGSTGAHSFWKLSDSCGEWPARLREPYQYIIFSCCRIGTQPAGHACGPPPGGCCGPRAPQEPYSLETIGLLQVGALRPARLRGPRAPAVGGEYRRRPAQQSEVSNRSKKFHFQSVRKPIPLFRADRFLAFLYFLFHYVCGNFYLCPAIRFKKR